MTSEPGRSHFFNLGSSNLTQTPPPKSAEVRRASAAGGRETPRSPSACAGGNTLPSSKIKPGTDQPRPALRLAPSPILPVLRHGWGNVTWHAEETARHGQLGCLRKVGKHGAGRGGDATLQSALGLRSLRKRKTKMVGRHRDRPAVWKQSLTELQPEGEESVVVFGRYGENRVCRSLSQRYVIGQQSPGPCCGLPHRTARDRQGRDPEGKGQERRPAAATVSAGMRKWGAGDAGYK